jgi:hypothetical protein
MTNPTIMVLPDSIDHFDEEAPGFLSCEVDRNFPLQNNNKTKFSLNQTITTINTSKGSFSHLNATS